MKNVSRPSNPSDELAQHVSKKKKNRRTNYSSSFSSKFQSLTVFSIIYMIRIRFFGPEELIQNGFSSAQKKMRDEVHILCTPHTALGEKTLWKTASSPTLIVNTFAERSGAENAPDVDPVTERQILKCCEEGRAPTGKSKSKHLCSDAPESCHIFTEGGCRGTHTSQKHRHSSATRSYSQNVSTSRRNTNHSPDGVTAEIFQKLRTPLPAQLAQSITDMFTSLDFETQWTTVAASLIHQELFPSKLSEFRPGSSLSTMRKLLGYVWLATNGVTQFNGLLSQNRRFARSVCSGESQRAREGVEDANFCGTAGPQEGLRPHTTLLCDNSVVVINKMVDPQRRRSHPGGITNDKRVSFQGGLLTGGIRGCFGSRLGRPGHWMEEQKHRVKDGQHLL